MIDLLAAWSVRSLALAAALSALLALTGVRNPFLRKNLWTALLVSVLLLPLLMELPGLPIHAALPALIARSSPSRPAARAPMALSLWLEWLYAATTVLLLTHYGIALVRMARLRARARRVHESWTCGLDVRATAALLSPATFGRTILLPEPFTRWSDSQRAAILAHERAHALAGDCYRLWLAQLYKCLCWFNPLAWWLAQHLSSLGEATSDAAAVATLGDAAGYAQLLLDFGMLARTAGGARASSPAAAGMLRSSLTVRIERILRTPAAPTPPPRSVVLLALSALAPLVLLCSFIHAQPLGAAPGAAPEHSARAGEQAHPSRGPSSDLYPLRARRAGVSGWVYVRLTIAPNGHVRRARLLGVSPPHYGFAAAALRMARTLHYPNAAHRVVVATLPVRFALTAPAPSRHAP